jgi:hypothetical protein
MDTQQRRYQREYLRKRKAEDPEFRARKADYQRAYVAANRKWLNAQQRHRYATDPEYRAKLIASSIRHDRRLQLRRKYGMSLEEFDRLLAEQNQVCAICGRTSDKTLCVDHCHQTGKVRGLLCRRCNAGLGCYDDEPAFMSKAAAYLKHWRRKHRVTKGERRAMSAGESAGTTAT